MSAVDLIGMLWARCGELRAATPNLRVGQSLYHALGDCHPALFQKLLGKLDEIGRNVRAPPAHYDPFYKDENIGNFLNWIEENYEP